MCTTFDLARSSYYAMVKSRESRDRLDRKIWEDICDQWEEFPGLGYRKLAKFLCRNKKQIQRILQKFRGKREKTKVCKPSKRFNILKEVVRVLEESPQKLARGNWILKDGKNGYRKLLEPTRPYQLWASDWKEIRVFGFVVYIFILLDVYTRQLLGYHCSLIKDTSSALHAGRMAIEKACLDDLFEPGRLILHRDNGSAYISEENERFWRNLGVKLSYSDPGKPTQNPYSEGFISVYTRFWLNHFEYESAGEVQVLVSKFFDKYNDKWKHSGIGYLTPDQKLEEYKNHILNTTKICPIRGA